MSHMPLRGFHYKRGKRMATVKSKKLVDQIIANNGEFEGDPPVHSVVEYRDRNGEVCWGLNYQDNDAYEPSFYVNKPKIIFQRKETK
jgi:hypothetical protein